MSDTPSSVLRQAPRHVIDWRYLVEALEMACEIRSCNLKSAAEQMGISASGLTRLRQGDHLSGDSEPLAAWLGQEADELALCLAAWKSREHTEDGIAARVAATSGHAITLARLILGATDG